MNELKRILLVTLKSDELIRAILYGKKLNNDSNFKILTATI